MSEIPKTKAECEAAGGSWSDEDGVCTLTTNGTSGKHSQNSDADVLRELAMTKAELTLRKKQLRQAVDVATKVNERQKAADEAEREMIITQILVDAQGKFEKDELKSKSLTDLRLIKTVIDKSMDQTFASIAALDVEERNRKKPRLTVGAWDSKTKNWVGGM